MEWMSLISVMALYGVISYSFSVMDQSPRSMTYSFYGSIVGSSFILTTEMLSSSLFSTTINILLFIIMFILLIAAFGLYLWIYTLPYSLGLGATKGYDKLYARVWTIVGVLSFGSLLIHHESSWLANTGLFFLYHIAATIFTVSFISLKPKKDITAKQ